MFLWDAGGDDAAGKRDDPCEEDTVSRGEKGVASGRRSTREVNE